jgi:hypothetical protein
MLKGMDKSGGMAVMILKGMEGGADGAMQCSQIGAKIGQ